MKFRLLLLMTWLAMANNVVLAQTAPDLYDAAIVHEIRLTITQANWAKQLDSMRIYGDGMLMCNMSIDGVKYENVGFGYRGSGSYQMGAKRNPFQFKLNYINKAQNHQGHTAIKLSNALRDPSMVREVLGYEIARKYMPAPRANYIQLYINNENRGLYVNVEAIGEDFLQKNFKNNTGSFFKCSPDLKKDAPEGCKNKIFGTLEYEKNADCYLQNWELLSPSGWDDLMELTRTLQEEPDKINKILNVDRTLWMLAFNNVMVNLSSYTGQYSHNYYLYKDANGQFNPIVWDLNLSFGSFKNTGVGSDLDLKALQEMDPLLHADNAQKPLLYHLLKNQDYKRIYLTHLRTILYDNFENAAYEKRALELQKMILPLYTTDPYKFYSVEELQRSMNSTIGEKSKIPGLVELMFPRAKFLKKHPELSAFPPVISDIKISNRAEYSNQIVTQFRMSVKVDKFPKKVKLYYRYPGETQFNELYLQDDGAHSDGAPGDKVFGGTVNPDGKSEVMEYYIQAENASMNSYEPANYMFQVRTITLTELNK